MWGLSTARVGILAAAALSAFVAGLLVCWFGLAAPRILAAHQSGQAALNALRADYQGQLAQAQLAARLALQNEQAKAEEADREYQRTIEAINRAAADRPPRVVRVRIPGACPVPAPGGAASGDPGQPAPAAADGPGVGPDGGYRHLDARGIVELGERGKQVSAQLRVLQERCGG